MTYGVHDGIQVANRLQTVVLMLPKRTVGVQDQVCWANADALGKRLLLEESAGVPRIARIEQVGNVGSPGEKSRNDPRPGRGIRPNITPLSNLQHVTVF